MSANLLPALGTYVPGAESVCYERDELRRATERFRETAFVVQEAASGRVGVGFGGALQGQGVEDRVLAILPPLYPEWLGDRSFQEIHGTRFPYIAGAMANGIATAELVIEMARAGMMGSFGAAGLDPSRVETALDQIQAALSESSLPYGMNLIHSPHEPDLEDAIVDLYLRRGVQRIDAAAYMDLTPMVVRYALTGLRELPNGSIERTHHVFAKVSRPEVAERFMSPAPAAIVQHLLAQGRITPDEARLAERVSVAEDITVEADSGGHTDNQALTCVFPTVLRVREQCQRIFGLRRPIRVGAAGGLGTPDAIAAAFALGAAYVMTGSVNQPAIESGLHPNGKRLLAQAALGDVTMAPAADMFEMGVKVQVLKRGTLFAARAQKLYDVYKTYPSLEAIPSPERARLEKDIFQDSLEGVWRGTHDYFQRRDPAQNTRAEADPKHRMALVFRWYLGQSSKWAIAGTESRQLDYQIWAGPALCAFNAWVKNSFLEPVETRSAVQIARNLLEGGAALTRAQQLRSYGVALPPEAFLYSPRPLA